MIFEHVRLKRWGILCPEGSGVTAETTPDSFKYTRNAYDTQLKQSKKVKWQKM